MLKKVLVQTWASFVQVQCLQVFRQRNVRGISSNISSLKLFPELTTCCANSSVQIGESVREQDVYIIQVSTKKCAPLSRQQRSAHVKRDFLDRIQPKPVGRELPRRAVEPSQYACG